MKQWKDELKLAFDAPGPERKREFIRQLEPQKVPSYRILFTQVAYIRKWVWCVSVIVFATAILGAAFLPNTGIWLISGLTPLLALTIIAESGRSECYGMAELEMATRFSLRSVILARLGVLGITNLLLLFTLIPIGLQSSRHNLLITGLYIVTPFLLTTFAGFLIVRRFHGQEAMYGCIGISAGVSLSVFISHGAVPIIYQEQYFPMWVVIALICCVGVGKQYIDIIRRTEEIVWNLS